MIIKGIREESFSDYLMPNMFIAFPSCTFKCERECGKQMCQNSDLVLSPNIEVDNEVIINRFLNNPITKAFVFGGLEPFDSWFDLIELVKDIRVITDAPIVIYTGYYKSEIEDKIDVLKNYKNIIIKFGRFIPDQRSHFDKILGVELASDNQYVEVIS